MTRDWKPGDVARVTTMGGDFPAMREVGGWTFAHPASYSAGGIAVTTIRDGRDSDLRPRPLVVIDPEDCDQVERLKDAWFELAEACNGDFVERMTSALRSLIEPPKPTEPSGLGAVVEDADGQRWTLVGAQTGCWIGDGIGLNSKTWHQVAAVKVLSEGVTP